MRRGTTGRYQTTTVGGERINAFVPAPLPPVPSLDLGTLQVDLEAALVALGRLDGLSAFLPDPRFFIYGYVRKEAVLSSQIEGTQSSLSDLLRFESSQTPGVLNADVVDVANYVSAMEHGLARLAEGLPLCNRLLLEIHTRLLSSGRGSGKMPGEFRRSQNWIGGTRLGNAHFVPPPARSVLDCMGALEAFLNADSTLSALPVLVRAGLAHAQFETIHPFLDGNGRVGRLLITLHLCAEKLLADPLLYLSLYFKEHRSDYYALLDDVRREGDWEAWIAFFLEGVRYTAAGAERTARRQLTLFETDQSEIRQQGRAAGSALRVHDVLRQRPVASLSQVAAESGLSYTAAAAGMGVLVALGVAEELTKRKRGRMFGYRQYIAMLSEGTEA